MKISNNFTFVRIFMNKSLSNVKTLRRIAPNFCGLLRKVELYWTSFASFPIFFWVNKSRFFYTIHFFLEESFFLCSFSNSVARADFSLLKIKGPFHDPMEHTEKSSVHGFSESVKRCFATRKRRWLGCIVSFAWPLFYIIQSDGPFPWSFSRLFTIKFTCDIEIRMV